jgi:PAS domain S-box-containing protein
MPLDETARTPMQEESDSSPYAPPASPEDQEREAAWRRGSQFERVRAGVESGDFDLRERRPQPAAAARAFIALAENVRDYAIFLMNPQGVITFWGEGARLIKWWTKAEAEGAHLRLLYPSGGSDDGTAEAHLEHAAARGEYTGEGQRVRSDGSTFWAGVTLTALWDDDGTLLGFAKVTRDLTARRAGEALLKAAAAAAEQARSAAELASRAKSEFLATMSHEIRTPVNAILGYLDLLSHEIGGPLSAAQRDYTARARRGCRHLIALIGDVLDFSRLEAGRLAVGRTPLRIGDVVTQALGLVMPLAQARGLDLEDAVSGLAEDLAAWGDESRVRQILVNLLANAVKFTEPRGNDVGHIMVSVGTAIRPSPDAEVVGDGPWVYVRVEDTGPGIADDRLAAVFEPFVQADMTLTREHGGTGLGLAISRRLARAMGGDVTARSQPGVGSAFFLWLPSAPLESLHIDEGNRRRSTD